MTTSPSHPCTTRPDQPPVRRWTAPDLWCRIRTFIVAMFDTHGDAARLVSRPRLPGAERNAILDWLRPAERMLRELLITDAITYLLMTPEGRRIRRNAKPITPPAPPPPPPPPAGTTRILTIPLNANLARHFAYKPNRAPNPSPRPTPDPHNPATWRTPFRILRWPNAQATKAPPPHSPTADKSGTPPNLAIARRIEALRRALADAPARMKRLARYIARLPRGLLTPTSPHLFRRNKPITTLLGERMALFALADSAAEAFNSS